MAEGRKIPQSKRLKSKKGYDIITVKDGKGNEVRQRYVKRKGFVESVRGLITDKPRGKDATGTGGRKRERNVMDAVDEAVKGASDGKA